MKYIQTILFTLLSLIGIAQGNKTLKSGIDPSVMLKSDTSLLVHKAGAENITGKKYFTGGIVIDTALIGGITQSAPYNTQAQQSIRYGINNLANITTGILNTSIGNYSQQNNQTGSANTTIGKSTLVSNISGFGNVGVGNNALFMQIDGNDNIGVGRDALLRHLHGDGNTAVGHNAGEHYYPGTGNNTFSRYGVFLGVNAQPLADSTVYETVIGAEAWGHGSHTVTIGDTSNDRFITYGRVGLNVDPYQYAAIDIPSTTKAALLPRMTSAQMYAIPSPIAGMLVYCIDSASYCQYSTIWRILGNFSLPTLTSGSIPFSNGSTLTQDNSNLFWDAAHARLGIGTNAPGVSLEVNGYAQANSGVLTPLVAANSFTPNGGNLTLIKNTGTEYLKLFNATGNVHIQDGGTYTDIASSRLSINSTTQGMLIPRLTTIQQNAISSPATGLKLYNTDARMTLDYNGTAFKSSGSVAGSKSQTLSAATTITVTFGGTQPNSTYSVSVTPTSILALGGYVNNKTTTTFDYVLPITTGTVTFDFSIFQ